MVRARGGNGWLVKIINRSNVRGVKLRRRSLMGCIDILRRVLNA